MRSNKQMPFIALGSVVRRVRKEKGLTQSELGDFAGCGVVFVNQVERGKSSVRLEKLVSLLKVLGLQLTLESGREGLKITG